MERWLSVPGTAFEASTLGKVRWGDSRRVLRTVLNPQGYRHVTFKSGGKKRYLRAGRLVCAAFHGEPPEGYQVDHLNCDRKDDRPENLRWLNRTENLARRPVGEAHHKAKLTADLAREVFLSGDSNKGLARRLGVDPASIRAIKRGESWAHATADLRGAA